MRTETLTFFPRITAPGSPWITMYFVPPRYKPVGARVPGSAKSLIIPVISSGLNCKEEESEDELVSSSSKIQNLLIKHQSRFLHEVQS